MKRFILLTVIVIFMLPALSFARIWRVNNTPGIVADFTTAQAAHDAAAAGDTLHFEPSALNYGTLTMTKRLVLLSLGSFLAENPNQQYAAVSGTLGSITINAGSENSVLSVNSNGNIVLSNINSITLLRCRTEAGSFSLSNADNIVILNCFVGTVISIGSGSSNVIVSNNIVRGAIQSSGTGVSSTITNNVISVIGGTNSSFLNATVQNNIFVILSTSITSTSSVLQNNLCSGNQLPAGNSNNVNMATVFVNPAGTVDNQFLLLPGGGNPAIGGGIGGVDCGAFGGSTPFVLGMIPAIPSIYKLQTPITPVGNSMDVIISTRSNN